MIELNYYYRRRHLDRTTGISITTGSALAQRDDAEAWVFDYRLNSPNFHAPVRGRRGSRTTTIARPAAVAARLWLWPDRPMRILQQFSASGKTSHYRVDFATQPQRIAGTIYQTDLYLDLFVSSNAHNYAIEDEDELDLAIAHGIITASVGRRVVGQCRQLVRLLERGTFREWLDATCTTPFALAPLSSDRSWLHRGVAPGDDDGWPKGID